MGVAIYVVTREEGKVGGAEVMKVLKLLSEMLADKKMTEEVERSHHSGAYRRVGELGQNV